ncbi:TPA: hypothetical protein VEO38_000965 [Providencia alcalifaciens]|nr:hypothetical protein [Providencia alcalifaciens]
MSITRFNMALLKQDIKILGAAVSNYIRCKFSALFKAVRNVDTPFPFHKKNAPQRPWEAIPQMYTVNMGPTYHDERLYEMCRQMKSVNTR